ncbi:MAG: helix-turn-helix domain-containing protein [Acidimicrobiia bacterium]
MARGRNVDSRSWTASQVVAHNLTRARELRGLTQAEIAERLARFTGSNWSQATVAQAEGSVSGQRVRQFTANELVALARTFDLPVLFFFLPPDDGEGQLATDDIRAGLPWEYLLLLVLGHRGNFAVLAERSANWQHVLTAGVDIPSGDPLEENDRLAELAGALRHRQPLLPEDVMAAVFHGLAARRMRGAPRPGSDVASFVENLRGLADALAAFDNYRPGAFIDDEVIDGIAAQRRQSAKRRRGRAAEDAQEAGDE